MLMNKFFAFLLIIIAILLMPFTVTAEFGGEKLLLALDGAENDFFGHSVSISGNTAIVGAPQDTGSGSAYVYVRDSATNLWTEQQKLLASDGADGDHFGYSVSISGETVIAGAYGNDDSGTNRGSAYIFVRNAGIWTEQQKLLNSNGQVNDLFGLSVSISGDTVVVSAEGEDDGGSQAGAAFIYVRNGITWTEIQKLLPSDRRTNSGFGRPVAINGDTIVIGKFLDSAIAHQAGSAYVFVRNPITELWAEQQKLEASDGLTSNSGHFGSSVAISNDTIIIGAPLDYPDFDAVIGSAYIFLRSGILWSEQQKLRASDRVLGEMFGHSVSVSNDTVVVGGIGYASSNNYNGASHIFTRSSDTWSEQNLTASDGEINDQFGASVSVSGDNIIVGARYDDNNGTDSGSIYAYTPVVFGPNIMVTDSVVPTTDHVVNFGNITELTLSDQTVTVTNDGNENLTIGNIATANALATPFKIEMDNCTAQVLPPSANCVLTVRFAPLSTGIFSDSFDIPSDDLDEATVTVDLTGTAIPISDVIFSSSFEDD